MTVTASGAITFSDIMNEFNPGGGQSNIKLGDYISRYPDKYGSDPVSLTVFVAWDGYRFTIDGLAPTGASYWTYHGKLRIFFALNNTCTLPFYIATSNNTTGSDLCSGVSNNGAVYNASSNYHLGSYTFVIVELETAAGGTSEWPDVTKSVYINTNQTMLTGSGGSTVTIKLLSLPDTNRLVTWNRPYVDFAFPSALNGGSEDSIALNGNASYTTTTNQIGFLKNGDSMTVNYTLAALPDARSTGTSLNVYGPYMNPVTYSGTGLAQGWSAGSAGWLFWDTYGGSGTNYINGSGAHSNNATGVANCVRAGPANPTNAGGTVTTSGWTTSWGGSGGTLSLSLTNNTGTDYVLSGYYNGVVTVNFGTYNFQYLDNSSNTQYTSSRNPHWGSNPIGDHYGQNFYPYLRFAKKNNTNGSSGDTNILMYCGGSYNRSQVISMIKTYFNTAGGPGISTSYPGSQTGANTKTTWYSFDAYEPTTGTLRIRWASGVGGTFEAGSNAEYTNFDVTPSWPAALGSVSATPTVTYSTGTYDLSDNGAVRNRKSNIELSDYYGTRNLGTDGG
jgi:hypothetical protein